MTNDATQAFSMPVGGQDQTVRRRAKERSGRGERPRAHFFRETPGAWP
eukprot:CAMPEP_0195076670 /NCGR_PEP_ID=MMETSP0448-20130528/19274_1 /TAXON_ID=66468 /ORGANISM="Heterocapsa triquestra, Strain CCMP 448" /LENGTH=47 /DNA_ID= /DNA_START= /DNA_END= /DNA_ORIENTATION=